MVSSTIRGPSKPACSWGAEQTLVTHHGLQRQDISNVEQAGLASKPSRQKNARRPAMQHAMPDAAPRAWCEAARYACSARVMSGRGQPPAARVARTSSVGEQGVSLQIKQLSNGQRAQATCCEEASAAACLPTFKHASHGGIYTNPSLRGTGKRSPAAERMRGVVSSVSVSAVTAPRSANMPAWNRWIRATCGQIGRVGRVLWPTCTGLSTGPAADVGNLLQAH